MATYTPNYNLPKYSGTDRPNLRGQYNNAMDVIDSKLHEIEQAASGGVTPADYIAQRAAAATTEFTVDMLGSGFYVDPDTGLVFCKTV